VKFADVHYFYVSMKRKKHLTNATRLADMELQKILPLPQHFFYRTMPHGLLGKFWE
jgi:hypothetical protein